MIKIKSLLKVLGNKRKRLNKLEIVTFILDRDVIRVGGLKGGKDRLSDSQAGKPHAKRRNHETSGK
jgi:hypothetical protein